MRKRAPQKLIGAHFWPSMNGFSFKTLSQSKWSRCALFTWNDPVVQKVSRNNWREKWWLNQNWNDFLLLFFSRLSEVCLIFRLRVGGVERRISVRRTTFLEKVFRAKEGPVVSVVVGLKKWMVAVLSVNQSEKFSGIVSEGVRCFTNTIRYWIYNTTHHCRKSWFPGYTHINRHSQSGA